MRFAKPALTLDEQLDRLIERGMVIDDRDAARYYLAHLNYYRLGAYWLPFEAEHASHQFSPGTTFEAVLSLYVFDRELRLLVLDAIERIEVSVRTRWAYTMAHRYGPHCHLQRELFKPEWRYDEHVARLRADVAASQETFIRHLRETYDEALPPIWALVEIMSFGQLSKWFSNTLRRRDRNEVALEYGIDEVNLTSFLHHLTTVRNLCAHHSRLWNREFTFTFRLPAGRPVELVRSVEGRTERKLYNTVTALAYMLDRVSPRHHWRDRLVALLEQHRIDPTAMGFPPDWRDRPVWFPAKR